MFSDPLPLEGLDLDEELGALERRLVLDALERTGGNQTQAAKLLRIERTTLAQKIRRMRARGQIAA